MDPPQKAPRRASPEDPLIWTNEIWTSETDLGLQNSKVGAPLQNSAAKDAKLLPTNPGIQLEGSLSRRRNGDVAISPPDPATCRQGQVVGKCRRELGAPFLLPAPTCGVEAPWCLESSGVPTTLALGADVPAGEQAQKTGGCCPPPGPPSTQLPRGGHLEAGTPFSPSRQKLGSWLPRAGLGGIRAAGVDG